jgi:hypothetical protein
MSSPADAASIPDPLPDHLKALLELNRDAETSSWAHDWHLYFAFCLSFGFYVFVGWHFRDAGPFSGAMGPFLVMLGVLVGFQRANERRARRRLQLLLTVIRSLQRRDEASHA